MINQTAFEEACREFRVYVDTCSTGVAPKKKHKRRVMAIRIAHALDRGLRKGDLKQGSSRKDAVRFVGGLLWSNVLVKWVLLPLVQHFILKLWDKYWERVSEQTGV